MQRRRGCPRGRALRFLLCVRPAGHHVALLVEREELVEEADGEKVPPGAVVKKLAEMWNDLGDEEKEPYNTQAKEMAEDEE